jgi:hypothetical protein
VVLSSADSVRNEAARCCVPSFLFQRTGRARGQDGACFRNVSAGSGELDRSVSRGFGSNLDVRSRNSQCRSGGSHAGSFCGRSGGRSTLAAREFRGCCGFCGEAVGRSSGRSLQQCERRSGEIPEPSGFSLISVCRSWRHLLQAPACWSAMTQVRCISAPLLASERSVCSASDYRNTSGRSVAMTNF